MAYGAASTLADASAGRDDLTRTLLSLADPPPGGIHMPEGGIPPAQGQQPSLMGGATPPGGMVGGMGGVGQMAQMPQMPSAQPAAFGAQGAPIGPMGPIGGPYSPLVKLPQVGV